MSSAQRDTVFQSLSPLLQAVPHAGFDADPALLPDGEGPVTERIVSGGRKPAVHDIDQIVRLLS